MDLSFSYGPHFVRSVLQNCGPNIFPYGPHNWSIRAYHQSIGRVPASVSLLNVGQVRSKLYGNSWTKPGRTQEIFTVTKIIPRVPPVYRLREYAEDEIKGVFYVEELQKVHKSDDIYKIGKILAEKKENGKVKVLVKWLGYDKNSTPGYLDQSYESYKYPLRKR